MKLAEIIMKIVRILFYILTGIFIIQIILKLTGHSPFENQLFLVFFSIVVGHTIYVNFDLLKEIKKDIKGIKIDLNNVKFEVGYLKIELAKNTKDTTEIKSELSRNTKDIIEIKSILKKKSSRV